MNKMSRINVLCLLSLIILPYVHLQRILLRHPKALHFPIDYVQIRDFKDEPCGRISTDQKSMNFLPKYEVFNITWDGTDLKNGILQIEIWSNEDKQNVHKIATINYSNHTNLLPGPLQQEVSLTNISCSNDIGCTLRLKFLDGEKNSTIVSCANFHIDTNNSQSCGKFGLRITEKNLTNCFCNYSYSGNLCEFKDECYTNEDCGKKNESLDSGICIDTYPLTDPESYTPMPRAQCYCKRDSMDTTVKSDSREVEFVVKAKTMSWLLIGWKPTNLNSTCKIYPFPQASLSLEELEEKMEDELNLLDCSDLYIGVASTNGFRIFDYYSQTSHSTPKPDTDFGQENSITSAYVFENVSTLTTVMTFRRKINTNEITDWIFDGEVEMIWAYGKTFLDEESIHFNDKIYISEDFDIAEKGSFNLDIPRSLKEPRNEDSRNSDTGFLLPSFINESIEEGRTKSAYIEMAEEKVISEKIDNFDHLHHSECTKSLRYPIGCTSDCIYTLNYTYDAETQIMHFESWAKTSTGWSGAIFNNETEMVGADAIIGRVLENGTVELSDRTITEGYHFIKDKSQDLLQNVFGSSENGSTILRFSRPIHSTDMEADVSLKHENCYYFFLPVLHDEIKFAAHGFMNLLTNSSFIVKEPFCLDSCLSEGNLHSMKNLSSQDDTSKSLEKNSSNIQNHTDALKREGKEEVKKVKSKSPLAINELEVDSEPKLSVLPEGNIRFSGNPEDYSIEDDEEGVEETIEGDGSSEFEGESREDVDLSKIMNHSLINTMRDRIKAEDGKDEKYSDVHKLFGLNKEAEEKRKILDLDLGIEKEEEDDNMDASETSTLPKIPLAEDEVKFETLAVGDSRDLKYETTKESLSPASSNSSSDTGLVVLSNLPKNESKAEVTKSETLEKAAKDEGMSNYSNLKKLHKLSLDKEKEEMKLSSQELPPVNDLTDLLTKDKNEMSRESIHNFNEQNGDQDEKDNSTKQSDMKDGFMGVSVLLKKNVSSKAITENEKSKHDFSAKAEEEVHSEQDLDEDFGLESKPEDEASNNRKVLDLEDIDGTEESVNADDETLAEIEEPGSEENENLRDVSAEPRHTSSPSTITSSSTTESTSHLTTVQASTQDLDDDESSDKASRKEGHTSTSSSSAPSTSKKIITSTTFKPSQNESSTISPVVAESSSVEPEISTSTHEKIEEAIAESEDEKVASKVDVKESVAVEGEEIESSTPHKKHTPNDSTQNLTTAAILIPASSTTTLSPIKEKVFPKDFNASEESLKIDFVLKFNEIELRNVSSRKKQVQDSNHTHSQQDQEDKALLKEKMIHMITEKFTEKLENASILVLDDSHMKDHNTVVMQANFKNKNYSTNKIMESFEDVRSLLFISSLNITTYQPKEGIVIQTFIDMIYTQFLSYWKYITISILSLLFLILAIIVFKAKQSKKKKSKNLISTPIKNGLNSHENGSFHINESKQTYKMDFLAPPDPNLNRSKV